MRQFLQNLWFSFVTSILVTIPLAFVLTLYNLGFGPNFVHAYLTNSAIALVVSTLVSIPATMLAMKIVGIKAHSEV